MGVAMAVQMFRAHKAVLWFSGGGLCCFSFSFGGMGLVLGGFWFVFFFNILSCLSKSG